ncbi:MAG: 50S ribosomal protein L37e [Candidatus Aenigmarchaeota archaeon]|nr:50S ribosomal protein L37e [Candidatus Aenigmarchaeota archaeon]
MTKGTPSMGKKNKKVHILCRRCGNATYHATHKECVKCGFGKSSKLKKQGFQNKTLSGARRK